MHEQEGGRIEARLRPHHPMSRPPPRASTYDVEHEQTAHLQHNQHAHHLYLDIDFPPHT